MAGPPSSPRPPYQHMHTGSQQHYTPGQYGAPQPSSMSRTSSAVSEQRPNSSLGQPQLPSMTPAASHTLHPSHGASSPTPNAEIFKKPAKGPIVIKTPSGAVVDFNKQPASPAPVSRSPVIVSSTPTPPPGSSSRNDSPHNRAESKSAKTMEEKKSEMRDMVKAVAKKAEDEKNKEGEERTRKEKEEAELAAKKEAEEKARREKEEAEIAKREAEEKARKEKEEEERVQKEREEQAKKEAEEKAKAEEEERKRVAEEEERKRAAEAARLAEEKAQEEARIALMREKEEERLKEEELAKEKELLNTPVDLSAGVSRISISGASTPASDDSMGPPAKPTNLGKRDRPTALNLAPLKTGSVEPAQPSAALTSLRFARPIDHINDVKYPQDIVSPNPALNAAAPMGKFKYEKDFLMQFQNVFVEKPSLDWDAKIKETVGETPESARPQSARPSSLGPRNASSRPGITSGFPMGHFGQPGGKGLPSGTTSEQRFAMSSMGQQRTGMGSMNNPLAQFGRQGSFPSGGSTSMSRTNSSSTLQSQGGAPQSPRTGSNHNRSQRGSNRGKGPQPSNKAEEQAAKAMPLTANIEVKPLTLSGTGWKPRSLVNPATGAAGPTPGSGGMMEPDMVQRKVKAALNKMTPEKFDKISDQILEIASQSKHETDGRTLRQVIQLTFEKATDEAHWASMYARFCKRMLEAMDTSIKDESIRDKNNNVVVGGNLFRKYLLNRCQEEFERGWKLNLGAKPEGETEEAAMLSEEYYIAAAAKRRGLGLVQFIGELYKLGMLTERIMHECVKKLVDYEGVPEEAEVESLTKLLKTIGGNLDSPGKGRPMMDAYFQRIQIMIDTPELPSRLRFMLMVQTLPSLLLVLWIA
jgi:translation initiation factor 4G